MSGYIYAVIDPVSNNVCYVGQANQPWNNIARHFKGSSGNDFFHEWLTDLSKQYKKVNYFTSEIAKKFHDPAYHLPEKNPDEFYLDWFIVGEANNTFTKQMVVREYQKNGQAWFNGKPGRKEGYTYSYMEALREEKTIRNKIRLSNMKKLLQGATLEQLIETRDYINEQIENYSASE